MTAPEDPRAATSATERTDALPLPPSDGPGAVGPPVRPADPALRDPVLRDPAPRDPVPAEGPPGTPGPRAYDGVPARPNPLPPPRTTSPDADRPRNPPVAAAGPRPGQPRPPASRPAPPRPAGPAALRARKAKLSLRRVDPWSVFVLSLVVSLFLGVITIVAGYVLYGLLQAAGVPASVNKFVTTVQGGEPVLTASRFVGAAALLAAVNVVLLSVLATLSALLYNVCATFTGGIEVTLAERD